MGNDAPPIKKLPKNSLDSQDSTIVQNGKKTEMCMRTFPIEEKTGPTSKSYETLNSQLTNNSSSILVENNANTSKAGPQPIAALHFSTALSLYLLQLDSKNVPFHSIPPYAAS